MLTIDPAELAQLESRAGVVSRVLIWITAKNRATDEPESLGLWSGHDARVFDIGGASRTYYGPALIQLPTIDGGVGLDVRMLRVTVPHLAPEVEQLIRGYEPRLAPVEIHQAVFSTETNNLVAPPRRMFKGWINEAPIFTASEGGDGQAELVIASASRSLTRTLALYRADADQRARDADDRGREYASTTGLKAVFWGEQEVRRGGGGSTRRSGEGLGGWENDGGGGDSTWT